VTGAEAAVVLPPVLADMAARNRCAVLSVGFDVTVHEYRSRSRRAFYRTPALAVRSIDRTLPSRAMPANNPQVP